MSGACQPSSAEQQVNQDEKLNKKLVDERCDASGIDVENFDTATMSDGTDEKT